MLVSLPNRSQKKALKGYLYTQGKEIVVGHLVARLCEAAASYDHSFFEKKPAWAILDGYYVPIRYPNALPDGVPAHIYSESVARKAAQVAEEVLVFVEKKLNVANRGEGSHSPPGSS
ncbi:MAG: HEPN domain-containing protein [Candidatus Methanomethyliaceae archaeon]